MPHPYPWCHASFAYQPQAVCKQTYTFRNSCTVWGRTAVRLKEKPSGTGCIREIRRGRQLWRADLFNHVRHSTLSFCPFYYDILARSFSLSWCCGPSRRAIRARSTSVPDSCRCVCWSLWIGTCENGVQLAGEEQTRFHHEHIFGWKNGIR